MSSNPRRQAIPASYLSHQGNQLTFVTPTRPRQQALTLTLDVGHRQVRLEVQLRKARETVDGECVCQGELLSDGDPLQFALVPPEAVRYSRVFSRTAARLRALSPELPNFRALSLDLSQGGMKLETEAHLMPGTRISMTIDLDLPEQKPVPLRARVVWCRSIGRSYEVGLQFLDLEPWVPPLLEQFQAWLEGSGLKPVPSTVSPNLEFPEPQLEEAQAPAPPAGSLSQVCLNHGQVELVLAWTRGERFRVTFEGVLVFRDNRGVEGAAFYDALDLEESALMTEALKVLPVTLDSHREVHHYQFLNRRDKIILEIVCREAAQYELIADVS